MAATKPERGSFAGHETFPLRYGWLTKAVREVASDAGIFTRDDAIVRLGVGKNMVRAIRHWGLACGVLEEVGRGASIKVSPLGEALLGERGADPYLEDPATLWVAHYELASRPTFATTWHWAFNHMPGQEFTKADLVTWLQKFVQGRGWREVSNGTLERDVDVFVRTYVAQHSARGQVAEDSLDSPLAELGLVSEFGSRNSFVLQRGDQPSLPDEAFAYGLLRHLESHDRGATSFALRSVSFLPGSPGRVFALTEDALMARLDRLAELTKGAVVFQETAGLQQIYVHGKVSPMDILLAHYRGTAKGRAA